MIKYMLVAYIHGQAPGIRDHPMETRRLLRKRDKV